ncbi:MAG: hypothetical protein ACRDTO_16340 [Mycobacterium sp.]
MLIELNIVGYRFSREIPDLRGKSLRPVRFSPRAVHWRIPQVRDSRAA